MGVRARGAAERSLRTAAIRSSRGGAFIALLAAFSASLVVGFLNAGFPDLTFTLATGAFWTAGDAALALAERSDRDTQRHLRIRWRVLLGALAVASAFVAGAEVSNGGYLKELGATAALTLTSFTVALLAVKLWERRSPLEVDWRAKLQSKVPSFGFLTPPKRNVLLVGASLDARMIAGAISYAISPLRVVGAVCFDDEDADRSVCGAPVLGHVDHVEDVLERLRIKGVFVDALVAPNLSDRNVAPAVRALLSGRRDGRPLVVLSELSEIKRFAHADDAFRASWRGHRTLRRKLLKASRTWPSARSAVLKRGFDIAASGALLLFLAPLLAVAAAAVRITMGAPVLFWQERPGRFGRVFRVYKLRSMREPDRRSGGRFSDGARLTHLGALLRRTRFDEIPQLFSVLRGEMSLVGPRPLLPEDMPDLAEARLLIRPGISGWAQVNGGHLLTPNEKIALDVWYAKRAGVLLDLWILLKSLRVVLSGDRRAEGAIAEAQREHRELVAQLQGTEPLMLPPQRQRRPERRTANDADVVPASHPAGTGVRAVV